jgi:hypothetical protein
MKEFTVEKIKHDALLISWNLFKGDFFEFNLKNNCTTGHLVWAKQIIKNVYNPKI